MKLYIMRHGPAEDTSATGRDVDRALTASGRDRVRAVARLLVDEGETPTHIFTSPLVRAAQTADIVAAVTSLSARGGAVETRSEIEPGEDAARLITQLHDELALAPVPRVMLVGHEPDLSSFVLALSGHVLPSGMAKAMVVGIEIDRAGSGPLRSRIHARFVVEPKRPAIERLGA